MAVIEWISIALGVTVVTILLGCLKCRRQLTEEEKQQRYFKKFRKHHMLPKGKTLSNRVDYIRSVSEGYSASYITGVSDHTYEDLCSPLSPPAPSIKVLEASPSNSSNSSFFDDSFQTVIEASSMNMSSGKQGMQNHLTLPKEQLASYLSLKLGSDSSLKSTSVEGLTFKDASLKSEGEVNPCFSGSSSNLGSNSCCACASINSLNDSYIVPCCHRSNRPKLETTGKGLEVNAPILNIQVILDDAQHRHILKNFEENDNNRNSTDSSDASRVADLNGNGNYEKNCTGSSGEFVQIKGSSEELNQRKDSTAELLDKNARKLMLEGISHYCGHRRTPVKSLKKKKLANSNENILSKSNKISLILPARPNVCSPLVIPGRSKMKMCYAMNSRSSDHTYESITAELARDIMPKRDSVASLDSDCDDALDSMRLPQTLNSRRCSSELTHDLSHHTYESINSDLHNTELTEMLSREVSCRDKQNDLSLGGHNTYESLNSNPPSVSENKNIPCENSAVVIGRRVSNPFSLKKISNRAMNKKKQNILRENGNLNQSGGKITKDCEERYSPFPSTKKLAFKSAFKQVASPRLSVIQTVAGNLNSEGKSEAEMMLDNLNIRTPEIKVENSIHLHSFDNEAFVDYDNGNPYIPRSLDFSGILNSKTLSACRTLDFKVSNTNLKMCAEEKQSKYKKSLPSLPDHFEEDLEKHCNNNFHTVSTPYVSEQHVTNYF